MKVAHMVNFKILQMIYDIKRYRDTIMSKSRKDLKEKGEQERWKNISIEEREKKKEK